MMAPIPAKSDTASCKEIKESIAHTIEIMRNPILPWKCGKFGSI